MSRSKRDEPRQPTDNEARPNTSSERWPAAKTVLIGAVIALFVLRPLYPSESVAAEGDGLPVVMLWLLALAFWAVLAARGTIGRIRFGWPDLAVGLLILWHSIAALWAVAYESPRPAINMLWEWIGLGIAFFLARQVFQTSLQRRAVGAVMIALAVVISGYGLYQYFIELPATRAFYRQSSDEMLRDAGLWFPPGSPEREAFEQRLASLEPMATFALTNSLAGFLVPWVLVTLGISVVSAGRLSLTQRITMALLLLPLGLCLLLTKSRSAYLALACGVAGLAAIWWGRGRTATQMRRGMIVAAIGTVLIVGAVSVGVTVGGLDKEILSEAPKSLGYRLQYWQSSWAMIEDMPIMGCGPGNYQCRYTAYKLPDASEEIADPHNFVMELWATAGTPALLGLFGVVGAVAFCLLRSRRRPRAEVVATEEGESKQANLVAVCLGALAGLLMSIPIGATSEAPPTWWIPLAGIPVGAATLGALNPWVTYGRDSWTLWMLAAVVLLIHLSFAGGIAFPAVAAGLWLLVALALNEAHCGDRPVSPRIGMVILAGTIALTAACYITGYQPTLTARTLSQKAYEGRGDSLELLEQAIAADRWAARPWEYLAEWFQQQYLANVDDRTFANFDHAVQQAIQRAPRSASIRHRFGLAYLQCYPLSRNREHLTKGIHLLESAASLYPNNCQIHADLAEALLLAGDRASYRRERDEALRLDELTPHLDKKLSDEQRQRLKRNTLALPVRAKPAA